MRIAVSLVVAERSIAVRRRRCSCGSQASRKARTTVSPICPASLAAARVNTSRGRIGSCSTSANKASLDPK